MTDEQLLLQQALPYRSYGPNYRRNVDAAAVDLDRAIAAGAGPVLVDTLAALLQLRLTNERYRADLDRAAMKTAARAAELLDGGPTAADGIMPPLASTWSEWDD